jgi:hypothetical protein
MFVVNQPLSPSSLRVHAPPLSIATYFPIQNLVMPVVIILLIILNLRKL